MKTIEVKTKQRNYNVYIGTDILKNTGKLVLQIKNKCKIVLISDTNVFPIYGDTVIKSLTEYGFECFSFIFDAGEKSKNITTFTNALNFCAECELTRSDLIIALGGGVTGDLSGFTAACYQRGIEYIQIPTSLLASVDSSVGGKTAIDLPTGKNLAGAFHQPSMVIFDTDTIKTLPDEFFTDGMAEVIKYGFIGNKELIYKLKAGKNNIDLSEIAEICVKMKSKIVEQDENDKGIRQLLNFGHTIGHSIEKISEFTLSHGNCVALGMCFIARACKKLNMGTDITDEMYSILKAYNLPTECNFNISDIIKTSHSDKKRNSDKITIVIPTEYGKCELKTIKVSQLDIIIENGR